MKAYAAAHEPRGDGNLGPHASRRYRGGGQGRVHAAAYARNPGAELVGIAGRNPARARALANEYGTTATRDAAELLEDSSIEAVSICTPTQLHRDLAVAALEQGKHVLCEMPPSQNVADMDRLTRGGRVQPHEID